MHEAGPACADDVDEEGAGDDGDDDTLDGAELTLGGFEVDGFEVSGAEEGAVIGAVDDPPVPSIVADDEHPATNPTIASATAPVAREVIGRSADLSSTAGC